MTAAFLAAELYTDEAVALRERQHYAARLWHAVTASSTLADGQVMADQLLGMPLLLSRDGGEVRAFINRCPHRGMPFLDPADGPRSCRRLVCPYHGWTYDRRGRLRAAAREAEFIDPFDREAWPLASLPCQELAGVIWVAGGPGPLPLGDQLDLLLQQCPVLVQRPRRLLRRTAVPLRCNWKVAHDNTLDDYHVAIAHPQTLHREQGPVRHYRHALSDHASLLATPWGDGEFLTFGLAPWTHLLLWPDGRLALIQFPPWPWIAAVWICGCWGMTGMPPAPMTGWQSCCGFWRRIGAWWKGPSRAMPVGCSRGHPIAWSCGFCSTSSFTPG